MYHPGYADVVPPMVSSWTLGWGAITEGVAGSAPASTGFEASNTGVWVPLYVPVLAVARRMWWAERRDWLGQSPISP